MIYFGKEKRFCRWEVPDLTFGKRIQLFLVDGTPNGRWICELSNWTGIAYKLPRNMIKESEKRSELASPGVYFLFGYDDA